MDSIESLFRGIRGRLMWDFFRKLFTAPPSTGKSTPETFGERDHNPVVGASIMGAADDGPRGSASAHEGEQAKPEYETFCASFCFRPGIKLLDFLEAEGITRLRAWLHWSTPEAEPKAFLRLMLELKRRGQNIWDQPGISLFVDGRWSQGGGPSSESQDALSVLAQVMEKPIKVYYRKRPGEPIMVMEFQP
jgi:hypothetical protein